MHLVFDTFKLNRLLFSNKLICRKAVTANNIPTIRFARTDEKESVRQFLRKSFFKDEPCNKYMKLITEETPICEDLEKYTLKNFDSGLNLIAEHKNRIVGVCINSIIERDKPSNNILFTDKKFVIIANLLGYVEEKAALFQKYPKVSKIFDIRLLSVDNSYRGKGIAKAFCKKSIDIAKEQGAQLMSMICTSSFSASIAKKNGFEVVYELDYADYKINGEVVLKPEHPHKSIKMLVYSKL
ncbi:arylalkylamine N-acetyltransferase 1-like [Diorhabda carinulata]|uniref:arylalkylamine N-acetyltransferase 1-like n=1 Tax=Diorhabda carinulata TaxID=1163345 RepID=UPI0025A27F42|nr:arylalkylamine N-acetyltransferase 1-like [Diorhabda carinulata]